MDNNSKILEIGKNARSAALAISEISDAVISEALVLFSNLLQKLKTDYITILMNLKVIDSSAKKEEGIKPKKIDPRYIGKKMSRNEPCLCGSGKKYKRCCGAL